ncbi:hypothetical protein STTU_3801 [Streptomyces sp. Tu6071]|nr:hypothetical protein STTU_3801 [Streptomyces sp. Tu6071]
MPPQSPPARARRTPAPPPAPAPPAGRATPRAAAHRSTGRR